MIQKRLLSSLLLLACTAGLIGSLPARSAEARDVMHECLAKKVETAPGTATVAELREACTKELKASTPAVIEVQEFLAKTRLQDEIHTEQNPYLLTAYKQNYILPWSYVNEQNRILPASARQ